MNPEYAALIGRIEQTILDIERVVNRAEYLLDKAKKTGDDGYWDGIALNLHGFYAGVERIFEDIARTIDQSIPTGATGHQDLLLQMTAKVNSLRPPVINVETRYCLDEYRGFRHIVRNVYTFHLHPARLQELTTELCECTRNIKRDLNTFTHFLQQVTDADEENEE